MPLYGVFHFCVFFLFTSFYFFRHRFFRLFYGATQMDPDGLGSCASHSDSLISLSYSMVVFSTKLFGLLFLSLVLRALFLETPTLKSFGWLNTHLSTNPGPGDCSIINFLFWQNKIRVQNLFSSSPPQDLWRSLLRIQKLLAQR